MIAVDTNILVYGHRRESPFYTVANNRIRELSEGHAPWAIPWPCVHEFLAVVTHPRIYSPPTPIPVALDQIDAWTASPSLTMLGETPAYWSKAKKLILDGAILGRRVHDAHIAALCATHGVRELWSADRDFGRFTGLKVVNPLVCA